MTVKALLLSFCLAGAVLAQPTPSPVEVGMVSDEAEAVLAILARRVAGEGIRTGDWDRLFHSGGYRDLVRREASLHRPQDEATFRAFVLGAPLLAQAPELGRTLARWKALDLRRAADLALAYLPEGARIRARIYPVIKPASNSFVFEGNAIFLALDPAKSPAEVENILAHELHHIGYASCCPDPAVQAALAALPPGPRAAFDWISAFGEGFAMLAAAGGPDVHPHAVGPQADRDRWDRDVARFDPDLRQVEAFLRAVAEGRLSGEAAERQGMAFFGVQGPWYTVGWRMAVTIERAFGRATLLSCMRDPRQLLPTFNRAVAARGERLATWSPALIRSLAGPSPGP